MVQASSMTIQKDCPTEPLSSVKKPLAISEEFCESFHKVAVKSVLEMKTQGRKPVFIKIA